MAESELMSSLEKLPWSPSLLVTYIILGWLLSALHERWFVWLMVVVGVLMIIAALSTVVKIKDGLTGLLKSGIFFGAVAVALLSFAIICMLHIFAILMSLQLIY